jgi:hypothetical protein
VCLHFLKFLEPNVKFKIEKRQIALWIVSFYVLSFLTLFMLGMYFLFIQVYFNLVLKIIEIVNRSSAPHVHFRFFLTLQIRIFK